VAVIKRINSASAVAALAISAIANGQQAPASGEEVETVVVTGIRESLAQGLENKKAATQVVESIVAEDIGKLPDNNVVEALQRVTGVQVTNRGGAEADGISIRGLPDITTTWNGRNVFTANGRALALQDIPANLVGRIDVFKTRAAEQLETGLAGQIDVRTRRPFDLPGFEFSVNTRAIMQEQRDTIDPNASVLVSNTWDLGNGSKFGALANLSYAKARYRDQSVTAGAMVPFATATNPPLGYGAAADNCPNTPPDNPNWTPLERIFNTNCRGTPLGQPDPLLWQAGLDRGLSMEPGSTLSIAGANVPYLLARDALFASDFQGDRDRPAATLALQFAPNETSEYTFEAFYQGYREELFNNLHFTFADWWGTLGPDPATTITLFPDSNVIKERTVGAPFGFNSGDSTDQQTDSYVYALNGKWQIGEHLNLVADVAFQDSTFETNFIAMRTIRVPAQIVLDFNNGDGIPSWHFNDDAEMLDPNLWTAAELFQNRGKQEGDATTFQLDGDYNFGEAGGKVLKLLKFGVRYDDRGATQGSPRPVAADFLGGSFGAIPEEYQYINHGFMDGEADVPTSWMVADGFYIHDHRDDLRALYGQPAGDPVLIEAFNVTEKTSSVYAQADLEFGEKFKAQLGVRFVSVDTDMAFTDVVTNAFSTESKSVDDVMPSLTLRYSITDDLRLRFNYGETLRRPNFDQLNSNFALTDDLTNVGYGTGTGGNPDLEAAKSKNYDLTAEWYFSRDSAIYGTLFRREIDGLVVPLTRRITIVGTGLSTDQFVVTQPVNASDGVLKGIELGFVYFPQLPGILNGIGVQGSFTKLDSTQNIPQTDSTGAIIGQETSDFFIVSDTSYNVTLAYDHAGFGGRLSYVWRDNFLNNNEARIFANPIGVWRKPEKSLDLQLNYDFNEMFAVSFDAVNLTQELQQSYYHFADVGNPTISNFGTTLISRQFALGFRFKY
jgi:iron complex outermembrane recepter protein